MAETILSPGVLQRENDQSFIAPLPTQEGASILGPTVKGPVNIPTLVTSFSQFSTIYGTYQMSGSRPYSFLTSVAANNYFSNGGNSLWVTRVVSQSFLPATSSNVADTLGGMNTGSGSPGGVAKTNLSPFVLQTISEGAIMNAGHTEVVGGSGALTNGTIDNLRWEVATVNTSSGTFSLLIRRGDDDANQKVVLESYNNLSLDPNSPNFISKVIGDMDRSVATDGGDFYIKETGNYPNASAYVRISAVNNLTPEYFNNAGVAKDIFTASLPDAPQSSSLDGAAGSNIPTLTGYSRKMNFYSDISNTDSQGLEGANYATAVGLMANADDYKFNVLSAPGLINANGLTGAVPIASAVSNTISRGDSIFIVDLVNYDTALATVTTQAAAFDSSYAAAYWPWVQTIDTNTAEMVWVPASTMIPGVYAFTDASSDPWFAPAGITRGGLGQVIRAERRLTVSNRDTLYESNVNPIATFPGQGVVVFGQKTLQKKSSALDRVNVRRLMIALKSFIGQVSDNLVFEQNTIVTRNNFLSQVNPYLESVQQRQGLFAFKVVMDDTNNTPAVIDRNQLVGQIFLQPTKTAEFIILDFNVLPTGATFPS